MAERAVYLPAVIEVGEDRFLGTQYATKKDLDTGMAVLRKRLKEQGKPLRQLEALQSYLVQQLGEIPDGVPMAELLERAGRVPVKR